MSRKVILLDLALLALVCVLAWNLRARSIAAHAHERAILEQKIRARGVPVPPLLPAIKPAVASEYLEVAQKMLFSKDRNPTVVTVVELPKPVPEPPVPPLPNFHGMIALFGDPIIILSVGKNGQQKGYHAGDDVGPFKLIGFNREDITLEWKGKTVSSALQKLVPEGDPTPPATVPAQQQAQQPPVTSLAPTVTSLGSNNGSGNVSNNGAPSLGIDMGAGFRACQTGDTSPNGTILDGYRKVIGQGLMGNTCHWERVK